MNQDSVAALMRAAAPVIAGFVSQEVVRATAPLIARIAELETRPAPERGEPGQDGKDGAGVTVDDVAPLISKMVGEAVDKAAWDMPVVKDGEPGKDAPPPSDEQILAAVSAYLSEHPPADGENGEPGKDGVGLAGAMIDREGVLHLTLTDGSSKALGAVVGKDGDPGEPGKDGRDGFSPEDFQAELKEDGRTLVLKLVRGENVKTSEVVLPVVLDRGVWKEGPHQKGDGVTWGGSFFIAQRDTSDKPETENSGWRLAVKRGRDGKDAVVKSTPEPSPIKFK